VTQNGEPLREFIPAACRADGVVFVDESKYQASRFGAVAAATIRRTVLLSFIEHWAGARPQGDELKWAEITDSHRSRAAIDCIKLVQQYVVAGHIRVEVLTWDRNDSRFRDVRRPDDLANLVRMLQHLVVNALDKWDDLLNWDYVPDEHSGIRWHETWRPLDFGLTKKRRDQGGPYQAIGEPFPSDSAQHPLIQVADLFAGYGAHVAEHPSHVDNPPTTSTMERHRAPVMTAIANLVRAVSYARFNGISTPKDTVINFWPYRSQGAYDHVPVRMPGHLANLDPESTSNERCSLEGCVEYVLFAHSLFREPLCPEHFREAAAEREAVEAGKARHEVVAAGEFWCEACGFKRYTAQTATEEYDEYTRAQVFRCPEHGTRLQSLLDGVDTTKPFERDVDKRTLYGDKPYPG
jgi:hypothetical protein